MLRALPFAAAVLLTAVCAHADVQTTGTSERLQRAREVVTLITPKANYEKMMDQMGQQMMAASIQQGAKLPPDFNSKMKLVLNEAIPYEETIEWSAEIYAARFSLAELTELKSFYQTPLGKKLAAELPGLMGEAGKKMGALIPQRLPALMKKHGLAP